MRALQRVSEASVVVDGTEISAIEKGLLVLLGVEPADTQEDADWLCGKIARMRLFPDSEGVMNRNVMEAGGQFLVVSQFTLHASTKKGNRPSYIKLLDLPMQSPCTSTSWSNYGTSNLPVKGESSALI